MMRGQAVFHRAPHTVGVAETAVPHPEPGELLVRTRYSAISPGTETLVFRGAFPDGSSRDATLKSLSGEFRYPFRYGYSLVGEVVEVGSESDRPWLGRQVFAFHPHQDYAVVSVNECLPIPEGMPPERALFLPNLETALNLVLDTAPRVGERGMVFGQGVVGLLTTALLSQFPLAELMTADPIAPRRQRSLDLGAGLAIDPTKGRECAVLEDCLFHDDNDGLDFAIELSGQTEALNQAIAFTGFGGRIVVGSWYGRGGGMIELGGHFHRRRLRLISSQVSTVSPELTGRWSKHRRWKLALDWLDRIRPEQFITHRFSPDACQEAFELVASRQDGVLQVVFDYA
jgi:2-desacetyl-2-hydroxyethyl bacteriochlorophyllide A dehydrogenase